MASSFVILARSCHRKKITHYYSVLKIFFIFSYVYICVYVCGYVGMSAGVCKGQKIALKSLRAGVKGIEFPDGYRELNSDLLPERFVISSDA